MRRTPRLLLWALVASVLAGAPALDAFARGGGPGGGGPGGGGGGPPMPGSRGTGPGRMQGGVGRIGDRSFGMGRFKQGGEAAKEWESMLKQADRKKAILERRQRSIDLDRHAAQEAFLSESRGFEAEHAVLDVLVR